MLGFKRLFTIIPKNNIRSISKGKLDPGIKERKKLFADQAAEIEDFDDFEADFLQVNKTHKQHERELRAMNEKAKYLIVKQKYFKEKFPNFLTWHDKEQMRYLHSSDPEEWCVQKLSESFPALPEVVEKIVKGNWTKKSQAKVEAHDRTVRENWRLFKENKLEIPEYLSQHLNKFSNRALVFKPFIVPKTDNLFEKPKGEFSEIISSYKELKNKSSNVENFQKNEPKQYITERSKNSKLVTLDQLRETIQSKAEKGKLISEEEKKLLRPVIDEKPVLETEDNDVIDLIKNKYNEVSVKVKSEKDYSHLQYPMKIMIPKKLVNKNKVYKLNDCYYDYDGVFLYRVPGME